MYCLLGQRLAAVEEGGGGGVHCGVVAVSEGSTVV